MNMDGVEECGGADEGDARVVPFRSRNSKTGVAVLRDAAGVYYAVPREVLACYRVADARLAELAADLAGCDVAALGGDHFVGGVLRTAVHIRLVTGGGRT